MQTDITKKQAVLEKLRYKLEQLTMEPEDWSELDKAVSDNEEYRKIVKTYQNRENLRRPICTSNFKVCKYCQPDNRCANPYSCKLQLHI